MRTYRIVRSTSFPLGWLLAGAVALLALVLSLLLINAFLSDYGDNARYMVLAKSLATGLGHSLISEPGSPPDRLYPYGYPALLALQMSVMGSGQELAEMVAALKLSSAVLFTGSVLVTYYLAATRHPRALALLASLLVAVSPLSIRFSSDVMSEIPFLFASLVAIALVERTVRSRGAFGSSLLAAGALAAAFYFRTIGAALIVAALAYLLARCGLRRSLALQLLLLALVIPWFHQQATVPAGPSYLTQFSDDVSPSASEGSGGESARWANLLRRTAVNAKEYVVHLVPGALLPHLSRPSPGGEAPLRRAIELSILLVVALGLIARARAGPQLLDAYAIASFGILSVWWPLDRLLVPLVPFLALYLVVGFGTLVQAAQPIFRGARRAVPLRSIDARFPVFAEGHGGYLATALLLAPFVVSSLLIDVSAVQLNFTKLEARSESEYFAGSMPDYANFFRAVEWLKVNSPPESVLMSLKPTLTYVYSGRKTVEAPRSGNVESVVRAIESAQVDYVVEDDFAWTGVTSRVVSPAIRGYPDRFVLEHSTAPPVTRVWRYVGATE